MTKKTKYPDEMIECLVETMTKEELEEVNYVIYLHDGVSYDLKNRQYVCDDDF